MEPSSQMQKLAVSGCGAESSQGDEDDGDDDNSLSTLNA